MTLSSVGRDEPREVASAASDRDYVEWGPIFAGAAVASAVALILTAFGSALGLALASPYPGSGASGRAIAIAAAIYAVWVLASASIAGGYLAGRLRHRTFDSTQHESEVRNGAHGLIVWAVAALFVGQIGIFASGSSNHGSYFMSGANDNSAVVGRYTDSLLRSERSPVPNDALRRQVTPILEKTAIGRPLPDDDRAFLSRIVTAQTGATTADTESRINATITALRDDVETARKLAILTAFVTAAALAVGAAAAWWAATLGGKHRDEGTRVALLNVL